LTKRLTIPPLQALIDQTSLKVERVDTMMTHDLLLSESDEEESRELPVNKGTRIADICCSVSGLRLWLPFELVTLYNKGRLVFADLAGCVRQHVHVRLQGFVDMLTRSTLEHVKTRAVRKKWIQFEKQDLLETEKFLASSTEEALPQFACTYAHWEKAALRGASADEVESPQSDGEDGVEHIATLM
jgi:hypothetical protein